MNYLTHYFGGRGIAGMKVGHLEYLQVYFVAYLSQILGNFYCVINSLQLQYLVGPII